MGCHTQYIVSLSQEEKNKLQAMSKDNKRQNGLRSTIHQNTGAG